MIEPEREDVPTIQPEPTEKRAPDRVIEELRTLFEVEPGVSFSIVDRAGLVRYINRRGAQMFLGTLPEEAIGRTLGELFGDPWAEERLSVFERIIKSERPIVMRHIRRGMQLQSTVHMMQGDDETPVFIMLTVEGEHDLHADDEIEVVESEYAHFGPLERLSKRELEVLALIGHGMTTAQIAASLHRSPRTIERHLDGLRAKLEATNRTQLAAFAQRAGLRLSDAGRTRV